MIENENTEYFEVFYHANEFSNLFKYSFDSLEQAESLIQIEHPEFKKISISEIKYPLVIIIHKNNSEEEITKHHFCKIES